MLVPSGYHVDELPPPVRLQSAFGEFVRSSEVAGLQVVFTRTLRLKATTIAPADYAAVRDFVQKVRAADDAPLVLAPGGG